MVELVASPFGASYNPSENIDVNTNNVWGRTDILDTIMSLDYKISDDKKYVVSNMITGRLDYIDTVSKFVYDDIDPLDVNSDLKHFNILPIKNVSFIDTVVSNYSRDSVNNNPWNGLIPWKDFSSDSIFEHVWIFDNKPVPPEDVRYTPTFDFDFRDEDINFTADFVKPIDFDKLKTRMSPLHNISQDMPWKKASQADIYKDLKWGYSLNNFLVGGSTDTNYPVDPEAVDIPPEPPVSQEVITFVNIVNIVTLPARTAIQFSDLSLAYDLDSISWVISFNVATEAMRDLVKPTGLLVTELEVNVNGELFIVFIGRTSTTKGVGTKGVVEKQIKCSGWSVSKLLSYPYHVRRSHVETSPATPAGILAGELTGTGFTGTWNSVSWTIPANMFTYIAKAPMAALSDLVQAVGSVIIPDPASKAIDIRPRYPVSPWNWGATGADINLSENSFFNIDTEWIPQESPDSVYIYGDAATGVAIKVVRSGQPGTKTLPTIVNKYFTDTTPATERGRIEVADNGFKEIVPISTYVDPGVGIIQPLQLVQVTETDGVTTWKGQVVGIGLNLKRQGMALVQTIQLERHYDL